MITLTAKLRNDTGKKVQKLRKQGIIPAVLYGPKVKSCHIELNQKEFDKVYKDAGESSLISLEIDKKKHSVLIHQVQLEPVSLTIMHVDFLAPSLTEEISAHVVLVLEGEAPAVKELGGTLIKNISEIEVKALPEKLPHEIKVDVTSLKTFEDNIAVKDIIVPEGVKILKDQEDIVAFVAAPEKVEEELQKPISEGTEEVEKIEKEKKEEVIEETKGETPKA